MNCEFDTSLLCITLRASIYEVPLLHRESLLYAVVRSMLIDERDLQPEVRQRIQDFMAAILDQTS